MSLKDEIKKGAKEVVADRLGPAGATPVDPLTELAGFAQRALRKRSDDNEVHGSTSPFSKSTLIDIPPASIVEPQGALTPFVGPPTDPAGSDIPNVNVTLAGTTYVCVLQGTVGPIAP